MIQNIFQNLKESMEKQSPLLKSGKIFLPKYLKMNNFTNKFTPVAQTLADKLQLTLIKQFNNPMPAGYDCGKRQIVDYAFLRNGSPILFLELESLDRSQLYLFRDHSQMKKSDIDNKLWYYYGTLVKKAQRVPDVPRYWVSLLILPDEKVGHYTIWDTSKYYRLFHRSLKDLVFENPYRFYDRLIKLSARHFLEKEQEFENPKSRKPIYKNLIKFQKECELIFITCTGQQLILSRGIHLFDPKKEKKVKIQWR